MRSPLSKKYKHTNLLLASSKVKRKEEIIAAQPVFTNAVKTEKTSVTNAQSITKTVKPIVPIDQEPDYASQKDQLIVLWNAPFRQFLWISTLIDSCVELGYSTLIASRTNDVIEHAENGRTITALITVGHPPENTFNLLSNLNKTKAVSNIRILLVGGPPPAELPRNITDKLKIKWLPISTQPELLEQSFIEMIKQPFDTDREIQFNNNDNYNNSPYSKLSETMQQQLSQPKLSIDKSATSYRPTPAFNAQQSPNRNKSVEDLLTDFLEKPKYNTNTQTQLLQPNSNNFNKDVSASHLINSTLQNQTATIPNKQQHPTSVRAPSTLNQLGSASVTPPQKQNQSTVAERSHSTSQPNINSYDHIVKTIAAQFIKIEAKEPIDLNSIYQVAGILVDEVAVNADLELRALNRREFNALPNRMVNTAIFALLIAKRRQFTLKQLEKMTVAALTHDFGMALVPNEILEKPGNLTSAEVKILRKHPEHACKLIKDSITKSGNPVDAELLDIVYQMHERMNGKGYPQGLPGNQIHPLARTLAVADVFEAFSHPRQYRRTFVAHEAIQEVARLSGVELDSDAVKTLVKELSMFPIDSFVMLNNGEIGKVIAINRTHPLRPVVEIIFNNQKKRLKKTRQENLKTSPFLYISRTLFEKDLPEKV